MSAILFRLGKFNDSAQRSAIICDEDKMWFIGRKV